MSDSASFQSALQTAMNENRVLQLDRDLSLDRPVNVTINHSNQGWFGLDGGMYKFRSTVRGGAAITIGMDQRTPQNTTARSFYLGNFSMLGGGGEDALLRLVVPFNDRWLVNPNIENVWVEGAGKNGIEILGSIFEGNLRAVGAQDCGQHGVYFNHAGDPSNRGVVSALRWFGGTVRSNGQHGICVDQYDGPRDIRCFGLYAVENKGYGMHWLAGNEGIHGCGFENNNGAGIYFSNYIRMYDCSGSTGGPQGYLVNGFLANDASFNGCRVEGYNGAQPKLAKLSGNGKAFFDQCSGGIDADTSVAVRHAQYA